MYIVFNVHRLLACNVVSTKYNRNTEEQRLKQKCLKKISLEILLLLKLILLDKSYFIFKLQEISI